MSLGRPASPVAAVIAADTHLDDGNWLQHGIAGDSRHAFSYVLGQAAKYSVPVILAGDVIDVKRPSSGTLEFLRSSLAAYGGTVYYIQGQHELADPPWLSVVGDPALTVHLSGRREKLPRGPSIVGLDWTPADTLSPAMASLPAADVGIMHQVWLEFMGSITGTEGELKSITFAPLVVTGDLHKYQVYKYRRKNNANLVVYSPGATHIRKINEPAEHYCLLLHADKTVSRVAIPSRRKLTVKATTRERLESLIKEWKVLEREKGWLVNVTVPEDLRKPLLHLHYAQELTELANVLMEQVGQDYYVFPKSLEAADAFAEEKRAASRNFRRLGPVGCLSQLVDPQGDDHKALVRLLRSSQPEQDLADMRQEREL